MPDQKNATLLNDVLEIQEELQTIRRTLHANPELAYQEHATMSLIAKFLSELGFDVRSGVAGTGVIADLGTGKTVALRTDMDGLPLSELNTASYRSKNLGVMHACGHDAHIACVLGAAQLIAKRKPSGRIRIIAQPAEEVSGDVMPGSIHMIQCGALDGVDAVLGLHVDATMPSGRVGVAMEYGKREALEFTVELEPSPLNSNVLASQLVQDLHEANAKLTNVGAELIVTAISCCSNTAPATISGKILRSKAFSKDDALDLLRENCARACGETDYAFTSLEDRDNSAAYEKLVATVHDCAIDLLGADQVIAVKRKTWTNRFLDYLDVVPGAFLLLGTEIFGDRRSMHSASFEIDETALPLGAAILAESAIRIMNDNI